MPSTLNGIGTRYYGKTHRQVHPGICPHCQRAVDLESYTTRLWFVVLFIPLVPLGRKQVLNYCPSCTRHRVLDLAEWQELKRKNIEEAVQKLQAQPNDPALAMQLHSTLMAFGQKDQADELLTLMEQRFGDDARALAYLASAYESAGQGDKAAPLRERAYHLDPNLPETRAPQALDSIRHGRLDEAAELLKFLQSPDYTGNVGPLFVLVEAYQKASRHDDAHRIFLQLLARFPELAQNKEFRRSVLTSEKAMGLTETKLPPRRRNWKPLIGWGVASFLLLVGLLGGDYYLSQHRTVHVVNGFDQPVIVAVDGRAPASIPAHAHQPLELREGRHRAIIGGATTQQIEFVIPGQLTDRWIGTRDYILNPGGAGLLIAERTLYQTSSPGATNDGGYELLFGKPFLALPKADYLFAEFPPELRLKKRQGAVRKQRLDLVQVSPAEIFYSLVGEGKIEPALRLAEWYLPLHPEQSDLLPTYVGICIAEKQEPRARSLFAAGIKRRPVDVQWHRMYQELEQNVSRHSELVAEYDGLLQAEPNSSSLLYLRGRLATSKKEALPLYQRAIAADPRNAFAHYALGYSYASMADWTNAKPRFAEAVRLRPEDQQMQEMLFDARIAMGEFAPLEKDLETSRAQEPWRFLSTQQLCEVLALTGKRGAMESLLRSYSDNLIARFHDEGTRVAARLQARLAYVTGDFEALNKLGAADPTPEGVLNRFTALVELGRFQEAFSLVSPADPLISDPMHLLAIAVAIAAGGDPAAAGELRKHTLARMKTSRMEYRLAANMLEQTDAPTLEEIYDLSLPPQSKAILLLALADKRSPAQAAEFKAGARGLNLHREFPYHLIHRLAVR